MSPLPALPIRLDIGCGKWPIDGFTGVDLYVDHPGVIKAPMWNLPFATETVEEIYSSHALEHIPKAMIAPTLLEWYRVLVPYSNRPSGVQLELRVPNLEWCARSWLEHGMSNDWFMDTIFGNQNHEGEFHKTGFTRDMMVKYLLDAGFTNIDSAVIWTHDQETLQFFVSKVRMQ